MNLNLGRTRRSTQIREEDDDFVAGQTKNADEKQRLREDREARLQRRKENKEDFSYGHIGEKRPRRQGDRAIRKRRRIDDSAEDSANDLEEEESELSEEGSTDKGIELSGKLNLVYEEHSQSSNIIEKVKIVLKGLWKLAQSQADDSQNLFLY